MDAAFKAIGEALARGEDVRMPGSGLSAPGAGLPVRGAIQGPALKDKRGQEGPHVEFGRLPFEDTMRSSGSAALRKIKQG